MLQQYHQLLSDHYMCVRVCVYVCVCVCVCMCVHVTVCVAIVSPTAHYSPTSTITVIASGINLSVIIGQLDTRNHHMVLFVRATEQERQRWKVSNLHRKYFYKCIPGIWQKHMRPLNCH